MAQASGGCSVSNWNKNLLTGLISPPHFPHSVEASSVFPGTAVSDPLGNCLKHHSSGPTVDIGLGPRNVCWNKSPHDSDPC